MERKDYIAAIDLGSSNVVVAVGSKNADGKLHIDEVAVRAVEGVEHGEIKNIEQVSKSIKEAVQEAEQKLGITITEAYAGISGLHIKCARNSYYVYVGRDGEIREDDVLLLRDNMSNLQAPEGQRIVDFVPQNYVIDGREEVIDPVGRFGQKLEATFNFLIGESNAISRLDKAFTKVGVKMSKLCVNPLVAAQAVVLPDEKELGVAVVDIGAGTTDICIYHDRIARHVGVIPFGSDMINKDIRAYGILERYIEDLKVKYGAAVAANASKDKLIKVPGRTPREPKEISFYNLSTIIEARLQDILDYVMEEIRLAGYEGKLGAGLVMTGGCAQMRDIDLLAKNHTGMEVRIAAPALSVDEESSDIALDTRLSTAVGLLLKAMENSKSTEGVRRQGPTIGGTSQGGRSVAAPNGATDSAGRDKAIVDDDPFAEDNDEMSGFWKRSKKVKAKEEKAKDNPKKKNPFGSLIDKITKQFEVIDEGDEF